MVLHRLDGDLSIEQVPLSEIAEQYGTPTYIYSEDAIRRAYEKFQQAFASTNPKICYAVKANSNIAILQLLAELGSGFDIVSAGELTRVLKAGGAASSVIFSGVGKLNDEIEYALNEGIGCFNVESMTELTRIIAIATRLQKIAPISIRMNPDVDPNTHPYIATGLKENKFGVSVAEALVLYEQAHVSDAISIEGIDCHIGSQITDLAPFLDALTIVLSAVDQLAERGIHLQHIDLGGGMGIRYQDETPLDIDALASAITQAMSGRTETLMFEPGRMLVANAGVLLTRVNTLKGNDEKNFAVIDAAMNDLLRPALYQAWHDIVPITERNDPKTWDVVGPVCETGDIIAKDRQLALREGDLLAVTSAGAYGFVMSSNYNSRGRAPEVLVSGSQHHCIRRRETIDDLLDLESLKPV